MNEDQDKSPDEERSHHQVYLCGLSDLFNTYPPHHPSPLLKQIHFYKPSHTTPTSATHHTALSQAYICMTWLGAWLIAIAGAQPSVHCLRVLTLTNIL